VLTKPSKGVKNDGYDNEDSDYILYVNDILGSEESGHKYVAIGRWIVDSTLTLAGTVTSFWMFWGRERLDRLSNAKT